jgi:hypothetical protein
MRSYALILTACAGIALGGCTTGQGALVGGATGAVVGGLASDSVAGAIVGGGIGALAGAVLVESTRGTCTYRYRGRLYREPC